MNQRSCFTIWESASKWPTQGAGGVGGLLWLNDTANGTHFCAYDGNGNIIALSGAADGTESGRYEYGPFGEPIRGEGAVAEANPFRFSTKFTDDETDLLYYGYRFYNANMGRWLSRDPIEEQGFVLLRNDPLRLKQVAVLHEGHMVDRRRLTAMANFQQARLERYTFIANDPVSSTDALGLLKACYQPMDWIGLFWHAYVALDDGTTISNGGDNSDTFTSRTHCFTARPDPSCKCPPQDPSACVKDAINNDLGPWTIHHNCGSIVRNAFKKCCLKDPTPGWLYYP